MFEVQSPGSGFEAQTGSSSLMACILYTAISPDAQGDGDQGLGRMDVDDDPEVEPVVHVVIAHKLEIPI